jgi:hypothetical protein
VIEPIEEENFPAEQGRCAALPNEKSPTDEVGPFFGDCAEALHSDVAAFNQAVRTTFGYGIAEQRIGLGCGGYGITEQRISLGRGGYCVAEQRISLGGRFSGNSIQCEQ